MTSETFTRFKPGSTLFRLLTEGPFDSQQLCDIFQCEASEIPDHIAALAPHGIRHSDHAGQMRFDYVRPSLQRADKLPRVKAQSQLGLIVAALPDTPRKLAQVAGIPLHRMGAAISGLKRRGFPIFRANTSLNTPQQLPPGVLELRGEFLYYIQDSKALHGEDEDRRAAGFHPLENGKLPIREPENNSPEGQKSA